MVETQTKNQNIFWLWSKDVDFQKRGDTQYWLPIFLENEIAVSKFPKLTDLVELKGGATPLGSNYVEHGIPFLRIQNIGENELVLDEVVFISEDTHEGLLKRSQLKAGDVLFTITGRIGSVAIVPDEMKAGNINQHMVRMRIKNRGKLLSYYLSTYLLTDHAKLQHERVAYGTTRIALDYPTLYNLKVFVPSLKDQQKVEQIVKEAFRFKKEAEADYQKSQQLLNEALGLTGIEQKRELIFWRWSNDIEIIKTLEPNFWKKTISSKKHPTIKFGDIFNHQKGTEVGSALYQDSSIPFLRVSDLGDLEIQLGNSSKCINETLFNELKNEFQPHKGELLFSKDATIGLVAKVETEEKQIISSGILRLQIKNKDFDPDFLMALLINKFINQEFVKNSTGSVIKHLNPSKLSETELPLVNKQVQNKVADKIKSFLSKRQLSKQKLQEAKDFVENLITK